MRFGLLNSTPVTEPLEQWLRIATAADRAGFTHVSTGDVQTAMMEMTVSLTLLATNTSIRFGPTVSNPITRDLGVLASSFASLAKISAGRAWLGIGVGNSGVRNLELAPATGAELADYVAAFRTLIQTGRASYRGRTISLPWAPEVVCEPIPVYVAASGPKMLRLAGQIADGVIVGSGISPAQIDHARREIAAGAQSVGRSIDELEIWFQATVAVAADQGEAQRQAGDTLAAMASRNFRGRTAIETVPSHLRERIRAFEADYRYAEHFGDEGYNATLLDRHGLSDFLADLWLVGGTPDDITTRLGALESAGVDNVHLVAARDSDLPAIVAIVGRLLTMPTDKEPVG